MNGFFLLWVAFQLGQYVIENLFSDPFIIVKVLIVAGLFTYALFIMRLAFLRRDISKYLGRIGIVSIINLAALLFIQNLLPVTSGLQLIQLIIAFVLLYLLIDFLVAKIVDKIYERVSVPEEVEKPKEPEKPRYERITTPQPVRPVQSIQRPPQYLPPTPPPQQPTTPAPQQPTQPPAQRPVQQPPRPV